MTRLVGGLDVDEEQVGVGRQRAQGRVAFAFVVGVEPAGRAVDLDDVHAGEHAESPNEIDRRAETGMQPYRSRNDGISGWKPWPQSHT